MGDRNVNVDQFLERAAIMEYDGGLSRFAAETAAAKAQGFDRWQAIGAVAKGLAENAERVRNTAPARDHLATGQRDGADNLPTVQPNKEKQA